MGYIPPPPPSKFDKTTRGDYYECGHCGTVWIERYINDRRPLTCPSCGAPIKIQLEDKRNE